jgi:NADH-quinone oxidoreductase subunit L
MTELVWIALALPLAGCVLLALAGTWAMPRAAAGWIASLVMLAAFACSVGAFVLLWDKPEDERVVSDTLYTWLSAGEFRVEMNILFDPLSAVMLLVVTGVGFLIHVYSIGYMRGDAEERRFFAYLNLFVFSMLLLVLAGNFVLLLAGWGMVGLSSYLLIGYWHQRKSAVDAAKKAFVMNAIGDIGLAIGIFLIFRELGTVDYLQVFAGRDVLGDDSTITNWVCVLLLIGALAKSAQVPLHTWLPDAMEGPTPVSALIHAATMVTAGVYLIARMNPLFFYAPSISDAVVVIGVIGLLMAGLIAIVQTDIKRIIAYSTMSQIAYMFVGVGLGAYWAGMFHLVTHAFFKALLFMGAGIVIHVLSDEQDVRRMGGLRAYLPKTYVCMWIGTLALVGIFPLSGGFSKDAIIGSGLAADTWAGWLAFGAGVCGAFLTGVYAFRLLFLVFHGRPSEYAAVEAPRHTAHGEGPSTMLWPVYLLAVLTAVAGVLQIPGATHYFSDWLEAMPVIPIDGMLEPTSEQEWWATAAAMTAGVIGWILAYVLWGRPNDAPERVRTGNGRILYELFSHKFYWDELYHYTVYVPVAAGARFARRFVERPVFQLPLDFLGPASRVVSRGLSVIQTGAVRAYALVLTVGLAGLVVYFLAQAS